MRYLSTIAPFGFADFDPVGFLSYYKSIGCSGAQFYRNPDNQPTVEYVLKAMDKAGVRCDSIHGWFGPEYDPSSPDAEHREWCLDVYEQEGVLAKELGGPMVVVHPSGNYADGRELDAEEAAAGESVRWGHFDDFVRRLAETGEGLGVTYLIENVPRNFPLGHGVCDLADHISAVGSDKLRMCFDTGHANMVGEPSELLTKCAHAVSYLHVHDNDATVDDHRMPGDGCMDWGLFSRAITNAGLDVPCMIEVFYDEDRLRGLDSAALSGRLADACAIECGQ